MSDEARRKLNWLWIASALVVILSLILYQVFSWRAQRRLDEKLAAIRASGAPLNMAEAAQPPVPADKNSAAVLRDAAGRLDEFQKMYDAFWTSPLGKDYESREDRRLPPTPEQLAAMRKNVDAFPELPSTIKKAANCPAYIGLENPNQPISAYLPELMKSAGRMRSISRFAMWKADLLLADGKVDAAAQLCLEMLEIARVYRRHAIIVQELTALALESVAAEKLNQILRTNSVSAPVRARVDAELAKHDDLAPFVETYKLERAFVLTHFDETFESVAPVWSRLFAWRLRDWQCDMLDYYDAAIATAALPSYQGGGIFRPVGTGPFEKSLAPTIQANYGATNRVVALMRSLRILNALAGFKAQHGREANDLSELALPAAAIVDPFSGKQMQLKMTPRGWIIYTVFKDGVDNGGDFTDTKDFGLAPAGEEGVEASTESEQSSR
jgi:hypothetical protein